MQAAAVITAALLSLAATSSLARADAGKPQAVPSATTPAVTGVKITAAKNPETIVCVSHDASDSRIPGPKECHPRRVWDQMAADGRDQVQGIQQRSFFTKNNQ